MASKRVRYTTVAKQLDGQPGTSSSAADRLSKELERLRHDRKKRTCASRSRAGCNLHLEYDCNGVRKPKCAKTERSRPTPQGTQCLLI